MVKKKSEWPQRLDASIKRKFGIKTETFFDLIGSMRYVTAPADRKTPLSDEVHKFIEAWMNKNAGEHPKQHAMPVGPDRQPGA